MALQRIATSGNTIFNTFAGIKLGVCKSVSYDENRATEQITALGSSEALEIGYGVKTYSLSVEMTKGEWESLRNAIVVDPKDLAPFDFIVAFIPENGIGVIVYTFKNCTFNSASYSANAEDTATMISISMTPNTYERISR